MYAIRQDQGVRQAALMFAWLDIGDHPLAAQPPCAFDCTMGKIAIGHDHPVVPLAAQGQYLIHLRECCFPVNLAVLLDLLIGPDFVDVGVSIKYPSVVGVGQYFNASFRQLLAQVRKHGRGKKHVAKFVAFEDEDFH